MKEKLKSYKFWISLFGAVVVLLRALGKAFEFELNEGVINDLMMSFLGVLVVLGIVEKPKNIDNQNTTQNTSKNNNEQSE